MMPIDKPIRKKFPPVRLGKEDAVNLIRMFERYCREYTVELGEHRIDMLEEVEEVEAGTITHLCIDSFDPPVRLVLNDITCEVTCSNPNDERSQTILAGVEEVLGKRLVKIGPLLSPVLPLLLALLVIANALFVRIPMVSIVLGAAIVLWVVMFFYYTMRNYSKIYMQQAVADKLSIKRNKYIILACLVSLAVGFLLNTILKRAEESGIFTQLK